MRQFLARIFLRNGHTATLDVFAADTCAAQLQLMDHYGPRLRYASVRSAS